MNKKDLIIQILYQVQNGIEQKRTETKRDRDWKFHWLVHIFAQLTLVLLMMNGKTYKEAQNGHSDEQSSEDGEGEPTP